MKKSLNTGNSSLSKNEFTHSLITTSFDQLFRYTYVQSTNKLVGSY